MYGVTENLKAKAIGAHAPAPGKRYVAVRLGLQNLGSRLYKAAPTKTALVTTYGGQTYPALSTIKRSFPTTALKKGRALVGPAFFELPKSAPVLLFRFRPFGPSSKQVTFFTQTQKTLKSLPPHGVRKVLHGAGKKIRAVVYSVTEKVQAKAIGAHAPAPGKRYVAVRLGLQNLGSGLYEAAPAKTALVTTDGGHTYPALRTIKRSFPITALKKGRALVGPVFFELPKSRTVLLLSFRPFGPSSKQVTFLTQTQKTLKSLPPHGARKVLHGAGMKIRAVTYGVTEKVKAKAIGAHAPAPGKRYVAIRLGLQNLGSRLYEAAPAKTAVVTTAGGHAYPALRTIKRSFPIIALTKGRALVGALFSEVPKSAKIHSFSFRPFGSSSARVSFPVK